jgi:hypothetical protein
MPVDAVSRSSMTVTSCGAEVDSPSSRPAVAEETTTWSAPLCRTRGMFSVSRTAATIQASGASSRAVSTVSTVASSVSVATTTAFAVPDLSLPQHLGAGAGAMHDDQPARRCFLRRVAVQLDDHDPVQRRAVLQHRGDGAAALGAVPADDDVLAHPRPPAADPELLAGPFGEHLERGAHQDDEEQHPGRRHDQHVDQAGAELTGVMSPYPVVESVTLA